MDVNCGLGCLLLWVVSMHGLLCKLLAASPASFSKVVCD